MEKMKVVCGILEQVGSVQRDQKGSITIISHLNIPKTLPPEANLNRQLVGMKVGYGILEQAGSVQRAQKESITVISHWGHPEKLSGAHLSSGGL